jgi:hypothetical protein
VALADLVGALGRPTRIRRGGGHRGVAVGASLLPRAEAREAGSFVGSREGMKAPLSRRDWLRLIAALLAVPRSAAERAIPT